MLTHSLLGAAIALAPAVSPSPTPSTTKVVHGAVGGAPRGTAVDLYAETDATRGLRPGQSAPLKLVGTTTTGANGRYQLTVPLGLDTDELIPVAHHGHEVSTGAVQSRTASTRPLRETSVVTPRSNGSHVTRVEVVKDYGGRWTKVGQWYSTFRHVQASFAYSTSASSSLGWAVSPTGKAGSFHVGGTKSQTSSATQGFGTQRGKGGWTFRTEFHYQKRKYTYCVDGQYCWYEYRIESRAWWGGSQAPKTKMPSGITRCVPEKRDSDFQKSGTKAYAWTAGVDTSGMTVVHLSSQTGFSRSVVQHVHFIKAGRLCGKYTKPTGNHPGVLAARPPA